MKAVFAAACCAVLFESAAGAEICVNQKTFAVAVHGGATSRKTDGTARLEAMTAALTEAREKLRRGASSLDVVEALVAGFEDSGIFNAGRGAIANQAGLVETDASIMDGNGLRAGSVASMTAVKNPVKAARLVMEANRHVLMVGDRGQGYVLRLGAEPVLESGYFKNNARLDAPGTGTNDTEDKPHGTVGAVALDRCGHLAAATSTGGFDAKIPGRAGDSPIVGAGVYAADGVAAFSSTGHGEYFIRFNAAKDAADRIRYGRASLVRAMKAELFGVLKPAGGEGGMIGIDAKGNVALLYNGLGMLRGFATNRIAPKVAQEAGTMGTASHFKAKSQGKKR